MATQSYRIVDPDGAEFISPGAVLACARALGVHPRVLAARDAAAFSAEAGEQFTTELVELP